MFDTEVINPVELGNGKVIYAPGIRAGQWVFATGHMAQDYGAGIASDVLREGAPNSAGPRRSREAGRIFDNVESVLANAGAGLDRVVRTDQYYTTAAMVPPFQAERKHRFGSLIPPSTSIVQQGLLLPGAELDWQVIALAKDGPAIRHIDAPTLRSRPTAGYSPALTVGDYVFIPGCTAMAQHGEPSRNGVAVDALIEEGLQWAGEPIRKEVGFIIEERLLPSLSLAGVEAADVIKAQIYLCEPEECATVHSVWKEYFDSGALSVIPCAKHGLAPVDGKVEINLIAYRGSGSVVDASVTMPFENQVQAVRTEDLLFLSALMAIDETGLSPTVSVDARQPFFCSAAESQTDLILEMADTLCRSAGTSLSNVVRAQHFLTDMRDFYSVQRAWQNRLPGQPIPFSAIEVPGPLPVPDASIMLDLWVYAPPHSSANRES